MTEEKKQELATRIMAEIQPEIDKLIEERDAARARAFRLAHLLRLVEDDIGDAHTLGLVRAELGAEPAQDDDTCAWWPDDLGAPIEWEAACGFSPCFEETLPIECGYVYCPKCGRRIEYREPEDDDDEEAGS
jgi:hypothetical protein